MSTDAMFRRGAQRHPDKPALIFLDRPLTYRRLDFWWTVSPRPWLAWESSVAIASARCCPTAPST